jgi:uncharacterized protein
MLPQRLPLDAISAMRQTTRQHTSEGRRLAKILLLVLGFFVAYWILKSYKKKVERRAQKPALGAEDMVRCAQCGVHLPRSESLTTDQSFYCSADHRRIHQSPR